LPDDGGDLPTERPEVELPDKKLDQLQYETEDFDVSNELTPSDIYDLVVHNNIMSGIHVGALAHHIVTEKKSYDFDEQAVNSIILYRKDDTEITSELTYTERATSFIRSGFSKINASAHLIIFKQCKEHLRFSFANSNMILPFFSIYNKTIFLCIIDIFEYEETASKIRRARRVTSPRFPMGVAIM
jgi:hypothetical protein